MHRWEARHGHVRPLYDWMREVGPADVVVTVLEKCPYDSSAEALGQREAYWIARLREEGHSLLNIASGGLGQPGVKWTDDRKAQMSEIVRQQMQVRNHLQEPEVRAKATAARTGRKRGPYAWTDVAKQAESGALAAHNRWHVARGITKPECAHCST